MRLIDVKSTTGIDLNKRNINSRIREMAEHVKQKHGGKPITVVPILSGSLFTATDFLRHLNHSDPKRSAFASTLFEPIRCSSYVEDVENPGTMKPGDSVIRVLSLDETHIYGRVVVAIDDIIDSGRTMMSVIDYLSEMGAAAVEPVSLLRRVGAQKPEYRFQADPDLNGYEVDKFVVGYGLDWNGLYRERSRIFHLTDD